MSKIEYRKGLGRNTSQYVNIERNMAGTQFKKSLQNKLCQEHTQKLNIEMNMTGTKITHFKRLK